MRKPIVILAAVSLAVVTFPGAMAGHNQLGLSRTDMSDEIDREDADLALDIENGFDDYSDTDNTWDLVLNHKVTPYGTAAAGVQPNQLLEELSAGPASGEDYIYPGAANSQAWWGWWNDKGSGGYHTEAGSTPYGSSNPDGIVDDGDDNHTADVTFSEWRGNLSACPAANPTCWTETGSWDEFVVRGPNNNVRDGNLQFVSKTQTGDDPTIQHVSDDHLYGFVQPGTFSSYFSTTTGKEDGSTPLRTPGYGLVSQGSDEKFDVEWTYGYQNDGTWAGALFYTADASLLITTEMVVSANPLDDPSATDKKDYTQSPGADTTTRTDVDVYSALSAGGASVETLYRTAVWDPGNNDQGESNNPDVVHENGPKGFVKQTYSQTYAEVYNEVRGTVTDQTGPVRSYLGYASDMTFGGVAEHEPNTAMDVYNYSSYCTGPNGDQCGATYIPRFFQGQKSWNDEYYNPNQSWSGYASGEHAWVDTKNKISVPFLGNWEGRPGTNADSPTRMGGQNTAAPGALSTFTRAGSWYDANGDTWIGTINETGSCSSYDEPYCHGFHGYEGTGQKDDPNDYSDHSNNPQSGFAEWEGTCEASVNTTVRPMTPREDGRDIDGDGVKERPWGTTSPPAGVYIVPGLLGPVVDVTGDVEAGGSTILDDPDNERLSNHVQYGPVNMDMFADTANCKAGQWFKSTELILPTGSINYPLKVVTKMDLKGEHVNQNGQNIADDPDEIVKDVDIINAWT